MLIWLGFPVLYSFFLSLTKDYWFSLNFSFNSYLGHVFFSVWIFFYKYSRFTKQQGKGEAISIIPLYHYHPLHRQLGSSRAITAERSPLHICAFGIDPGACDFWTQLANH